MHIHDLLVRIGKNIFVYVRETFSADFTKQILRANFIGWID